jgi:hypothetical protein
MGAALTGSQLHRHPVWETIRDASYYGAGGIPSDDDLAGLRVAPEHVRAIEAACCAVAAVHDRGEHQLAWEKADTAAQQIIDRLPEPQRDPEYLADAQRDARMAEFDDLSPRELAALIKHSF